MSLRALPGGKRAHEPGPQRLAPGAPRSPSQAPLDLIRYLHFGEALIWWGEKDRMERGPILLAAGLAVGALALVTGLAPELWQQPWRSLWQPVLAIFSPLIFAMLREYLGRRAVLVTDTAIIDVDMNGRSQRIAFDNIREVRRDLLRGGLRLDGAHHRVHIPAVLSEDARTAIASQRRSRVRTNVTLRDPTGWLP